MCLLSFSFTTFNFVADHVILILACNSFFCLFFCIEIESRTSNRVRSFFDPKATVFWLCCFHLEENGDSICHEVSGTISSLVSAFCFMLFHAGRFEIPPDHVRMVSVTFHANLKLGIGERTLVLKLSTPFRCRKKNELQVKSSMISDTIKYRK